MKWALILGSSGDIGRQIARDLAQQGWSLYLHYAHQQERIEKLIGKFQSKFPRQDFIPIQSDFMADDCVDRIANSIFGVDTVIFAQGTTHFKFLHDFTESELDEILRMQLKVPMVILQRLEDKLARSQAGRVVFISSVYGKSGSAMETPYSAVKGAINTFVKAYSKEVASMGITVNAVAPGAVNTQMNQMFDAETLATVRDEIPVGHLADPAEISYWVRVLLAPEAGYMTGQTLYVTGGWLE